MTIDINSRRRMVVNKFSNRPPFDLKNKETPVSKNVEKRKKSFESVDKSFKSIIEQLNSVQIQESTSDPNSNKTNNIIPKIIESFQKVTPTRQVVFLKNKQNNLSSKDSSLQTLYRNSQNFGKHIPKHKIMTNLLQDFDDETGTKHQNSCYDTVPTKDTGCVCLNKSDEYSLKSNVDKTTSTSGLVWPIVLQHGERVPIRINRPHKSLVKSRSRIPKRKDIRKKIGQIETCAGNEGSKPSIGSSDIEYVPIKERPDFADGSQTNHKQPNNRHLCMRENTYVLEENWEDGKPDRKKEKSFVQDQVDKFNKLTSYSPRKKKWEKMNSNMNKNYMGMMTSVKKHFPKMTLGAEHTTTDNYEWSNAEEDTADVNVRFPRETRNAMETLIQDSRKYTMSPLSKYSKYQDGKLQPAIPEYAMDNNKMRLPCPENLMGDRGDCEGPCANMKKTSICRHKKRRSKGAVR